MDCVLWIISNNEFTGKVNTYLQTKVKKSLGLVGSNIYAVPYKLLVYNKGGKFVAHRDTEKEDNMFGTLIVQLPSIFTGGNLTVTHNSKTLVFNNSECSSTHCKVVAHYASCLHELEEITSGYRTALVYSLCWDGNGMKPSPDIAPEQTIHLSNLLNMYLDLKPFFCWFLDNLGVKIQSLILE